VRRATLDPELEVIATAPRELRYAAGADAMLDRPEHVRAASAVAFFGPRLAIVQDDANFLALVDPHSGAVTSFALATGDVRQFDDTRGNKAHKLDLEACVVVPSDVGPTLLALGSGSTARRETILVARGLDGDEPALQLVPAHALYAALRARTEFSGSELNIEGAACVGGTLRLFNRGNGAPRDELLPVDATCDLVIADLLAHLAGGALPAIDAITQYGLGAIDNVRLGFTDAAVVGERVFYLAAAEDSPDAVRDGPVAGVAIGVIDGERVRYARVRTELGVFDGKAEGLAFDPEDPRRGYLVIDRDDPTTAAEIWNFELRGAW
jgi:hypothetical protein